MDFEEILKILENMITKKRLIHSLGVVESAKKLARIYNTDIKKAEIAALLHDCGKCLKKEEVLHYVKKYDILLDEIEKKELELAHGKVGAYLAKNIFKIEDDEIFSAITYHTTGKKNMTKLDKIIYLADFIEPNRNYSGVEELRNIAYNDNLDKALLMSFDNTIKYVVSIKKIIHPRTIEARNFLLEQLNKL
ncbi:bis(5'-nucleosyl)-tetraphosphatase (symmetrical) YqeK [Tepidibacter formicigenes]|jgi:predicted HD superfamily hydrolase involved in NAD metabolism|uniref:bis(5'-nucleosyl)-tetraphosphatase (symmetrical) n=1 Tax=Tepidibacter formicigenes DSM 15518 TaxID=1123349 RepID=A0A1M6JYA4_9FIRM|nr:bis(5'-nucleosyl)-tetraphosphatase (symmetrical) YqeK [Tepidibacter formicigenes]SHJ51680.1 putative HD superfamily hydrolase of NAD metabolism [Tepidibacter formicigenes DSM 15518]